MKFNEELVKKLQSGKIAVRNDGSIEELRQLLRHAFPENVYRSRKVGSFYFAYGWSYQSCDDIANLPYHSIKDFFIQEPTKEDLIEQLKELSLKEGLKCDVVFEKVPEKTNITVIESAVEHSNDGQKLLFSFQSTKHIKSRIAFDAASYLASCLEKYLNEEL